MKMGGLDNDWAFMDDIELPFYSMFDRANPSNVEWCDPIIAKFIVNGIGEKIELYSGDKTIKSVSGSISHHDQEEGGFDIELLYYFETVPKTFNSFTPNIKVISLSYRDDMAVYEHKHVEDWVEGDTVNTTTLSKRLKFPIESILIKARRI